MVSFDRVKAGSFTWAIVAEIDMTEIMASPNRIRDAILLFNGLVLLVIIVIAYMLEGNNQAVENRHDD